MPKKSITENSLKIGCIFLEKLRRKTKLRTKLRFNIELKYVISTVSKIILPHTNRALNLWRFGKKRF